MGTEFEHKQGMTWGDFCRRGAIGLASLIALLFFVEGTALGATGLRTDYPDIFAKEDICVESGQTIGRLLVTGGNITVGGVVEKGVVVVDGNLFLTSGAHIKGVVVVLGGYVNREEGAMLERPVLALTPGKAPVAGFVVLSLLLLGVLSLVAIPIAVWLTARIFKNTRPYWWMKERFLLLQQRWPALYVVFTLAISGLMLAFFAEMAWETLFRHQMDVFDNVFIWLVRYFTSPGIDRVMILISELGYGYLYWAVILTVLLTLAIYRRWLEINGMIVCLSGAAFLNFLLKHLFERSRPELFRVVEASGYSFPSGHAMVSLCFYGMLAFLIARHIHRWRLQLVVSTLAAALVAAIGVSRIYLGVHYPTDVVAGYTAGAMWLAFCISLLMWWERKREEKEVLM